MATIRASCTDCGDVELTTADVTVRVCADDNQGSYSFRCPVCRMAVVKPAEPRIVELLVASGRAPEPPGGSPRSWPSPARASPINHDDLLDFHDLLADDEQWFLELARLVEG